MAGFWDQNTRDSALSIQSRQLAVVMAEGDDLDVVSMFEDDFAEEVEVNPDSELDSSSEVESSEESPTPPSRNTVLGVVFQAQLKEEAPKPSRKKLKVKCC